MKLVPATLFQMDDGKDKCPEIGDTVLSAKIVNGSVCVVDQHGKMVQGLKAASISSDVKNVTTITLTVRSHTESIDDSGVIRVSE
jgi:hypothetical protein